MKRQRKPQKIKGADGKWYYPTTMAAKLAGIDPATLRNLFSMGKVKATKRGMGEKSPLYFSEDEVAKVKSHFAIGAC